MLRMALAVHETYMPWAKGPDGDKAIGENRGADDYADDDGDLAGDQPDVGGSE